MKPTDLIKASPAFQKLLHSRCEQIWQNIKRKKETLPEFSDEDIIRLAIIESYFNGFYDAANSSNIEEVEFLVYLKNLKILQ